jgi:hypothetical protein
MVLLQVQRNNLRLRSQKNLKIKTKRLLKFKLCRQKLFLSKPRCRIQTWMLQKESPKKKGRKPKIDPSILDSNPLETPAKNFEDFS